MKPFKKQSGFALPLIILIVVLVIAGTVGYYWYRTSQQEEKETEVEKEAKIGKSVAEEKKPKLTPHQALKKWYQDIVNENWDKVFESTININGKAYSEQCKRKVKEMLEHWGGAEYSLELEPTTVSCMESYMSTIHGPISKSEVQNLERLGCRAIVYSLKMDTVESGESSVEGASHWLIPQEGK